MAEEIKARAKTIILDEMTTSADMDCKQDQNENDNQNENENDNQDENNKQDQDEKVKFISQKDITDKMYALSSGKNDSEDCNLFPFTFVRETSNCYICGAANSSYRVAYHALWPRIPPVWHCCDSKICQEYESFITAMALEYHDDIFINTSWQGLTVDILRSSGKMQKAKIAYVCIRFADSSESSNLNFDLKKSTVGVWWFKCDKFASAVDEKEKKITDEKEKKITNEKDQKVVDDNEKKIADEKDQKITGEKEKKIIDKKGENDEIIKFLMNVEKNSDANPDFNLEHMFMKVETSFDGDSNIQSKSIPFLDLMKLNSTLPPLVVKTFFK